MFLGDLASCHHAPLKLQLLTSSSELTVVVRAVFVVAAVYLPPPPTVVTSRSALTVVVRVVFVVVAVYLFPEHQLHRHQRLCHSEAPAAQASRGVSQPPVLPSPQSLLGFQR